MWQGGSYAFQVTLTLPQAISTTQLKSGGAGSAWGKKLLNTTDYALLVTVPAGGQATYKHTGVSPGLKPASLKRPTVQQPSGDLLWARVPMPLYQNKNSTRRFKVGV